MTRIPWVGVVPDRVPNMNPQKPVPKKPVNVKGVQLHLKKAGYRIRMSGKMDSMTLSALADYHSGVKHRNPAAWSKKNGLLVPGHTQPPKPVATVPGPRNAQHPKGRYGIPDKPTHPKPDGVVPVTPTAFQGGPQFAPVGAGALPGGAQLLGPGMVDQIGNAYDPVIGNLRSQQDAARRAAAANADEVRGWYGQVTDHLGKAAQYDKAINAAAQQSARQNAQAIVASLGGAANDGAGMVGAAGAQDADTLAAIGAAQEQYNANMGPLIEGEGAGMASRVSAQGAKNVAELAARIAEAQSQKAGSRAEALMNIAQINNEIRNGRYDRAFQLRQYNDSLKQNAFNNNVTMAQLIAASQAMGQKVQSSAAKTSYTWAKAPQSVRNAAATQIANLKGMNYPQAVATAKGIIRGYGWSLTNPAVRAFMLDMLRQAGFTVDPRTN